MDDSLVLSYHAVSDDWPADLSVTPHRLERQLRLLAARGYRGVTFSELASGGRGRRVALTFDDGFRSVFALALPLLRNAGFPGTLFVTTDHVGSGAPMSWAGIDRWLGGAHECELLPVTWKEAGELATAGWEIGSHTRSHSRLTQIDDSRLRDELVCSREAVEDALGRPCRTLAYPYGDYDQRVARAARAAGYELACTLPRRLGPERPLEWPRLGVFRGDDDRRFRLKLSRPVRWLRGSAAWSVLRP